MNLFKLVHTHSKNSLGLLSSSLAPSSAIKPDCPISSNSPICSNQLSLTSSIVSQNLKYKNSILVFITNHILLEYCKFIGQPIRWLANKLLGN